MSLDIGFPDVLARRIDNISKATLALAQPSPDLPGLPPVSPDLSRVVVDLSGRPGLDFKIDFVRARIGEFDVDLVHEFFQGFTNHALVTLHVDSLKGDNAHHQAETAFKAFGRALRMAVELDPRIKGVPSTKGTL